MSTTNIVEASDIEVTFGTGRAVGGRAGKNKPGFVGLLCPIGIAAG